MDEAPRSNRPTPRTPAAIEAELRRRIRSELAQAREAADGELDDAALAGVIGHAIAMALGWHLESPEHTRNATLSSRTWRGAGGPRSGAGEARDFPVRGAGPPREFPTRGGSPPRGFGPPRDFPARGAAPSRGGFGPPRDFPRRGPDLRSGRGPRPFGAPSDFDELNESEQRPRGPRRFQDPGSGPDAPDDAALRGFDEDRPRRGPKPRRQPGPRRGGGRPPGRGGFGKRRSR